MDPGPAQSLPKGPDLKSMPIPSPRHLSAAKMAPAGQNDGQVAVETLKQVDRADSPCNPDRWTFGNLDWGEQSLAVSAEEVDYLQQTNKKLQEDLTDREQELELLRIEAELQESASEARIAEKTAALVDEVYRAQRERDEAVMARLRLANEERDEALLRVQQLQMFLKELEDINPEEGDTTIQELLSRLVEAEGGMAIQRNGELILQHIQKSRERRELITAEEMGVVIQERDFARTQCKHLEKELHLLRESRTVSTDTLTAQRTFESTSKAPLTFLQQDQDAVIENYKKLEEELQTLRVYYSLHQSLSQEVNLKEQYSRAITLYEEVLKNREELLSITQRQNQEMGLQLQLVQNQSAEMQESLQRAASYQRETEEKVHK
ncbi:mirror-image polydactyly gene 1 protein [Pelodytes ibericus]